MFELEIVIAGFIISCMSTYLGYVFFKISHQLAKAIAIVVWGGALTGFVTVAFSTASYLGYYAKLDELLIFTFRVLIFAGLGGADLIALYIIRRIRND